MSRKIYGQNDSINNDSVIGYQGGFLLLSWNYGLGLKLKIKHITLLSKQNCPQAKVGTRLLPTRVAKRGQSQPHTPVITATSSSTEEEGDGVVFALVRVQSSQSVCNPVPWGVCKKGETGISHPE